MGDLVARFNLATSGSSAGTPAGAKPAAPAPAKAFECKLFCKSANGPTITRRIDAGSRKEAARIASDRADEFCERYGHGRASPVAFAESQCLER